MKTRFFTAPLAALLAAACTISTAHAAVQMIAPLPAVTKAKSTAITKSAALNTDTTPVAFNADALGNMSEGEEALLTLPNGQQYAVKLDKRTVDAYGNRGWVGHLRDHGKHFPVIATTGDGGTFASIQTPDAEWSIMPGDAPGVNLLVNATAEAKLLKPKASAPDYKISHRDIDADIHNEHVDGISQNVLERNRASRQQQARDALAGITKAAPSPVRTVDIMFVVSQGFADALGTNLEARLAQAVATANTAFQNSEVAIQLNKVGATLIRNYSDTATNNETSLNDVTNNTGVFADVESTRASVGADLVALFRLSSVNGGSGIAWLGQVNNLGGAETWGNPALMYSSTLMCNLAGNLCDSIFVHEIGHNMGLQHDLANADATLPSGMRPYSYGWKVNSGNTARDFRTIMSYPQPSFRALVFSNPNLFTCNPAGYTPADACGVANTADNARVLNENRTMVSNIKTATGGPVTPSAVLTANLVRYPINATSASVRISRVGSNTSTMSVNYATANGSAAAGVDYTAVSGTVSWAAGDSTDRIINIPLLATGASDDRTFNVGLSNIVGASGAFIATPAQLAITRAGAGVWPLNGALPAGWTVASGANASWDIATDQAQEGSYSLKSQPIANSQTAGIQFTAQVNAGNLSFYRRVSSESTYDFFRVYVDGVEFAEAAASGDSGWQFFSIPLTAGSHTITFRYIKDNTVAEGADAAWIDNLTLPTVATGVCRV